MEAGDVLLVRGPAPYRMASAPGLAPGIVIGPDQRCTGVGGRDLSAEPRTGVGTWGNDAPGPDSMVVVGTYRSAGEVGRILIDALPRDVVVALGRTSVVDLIAVELGRDALAQASLLDRLLDVLLIAAVRGWADAADSAPATWLGAARDPEVAAAVRLIHHAPERAWTAGSLAVALGVSRASLARRFHDVVGAPPMTYLAQWRLAVAADLLADPVVTLTAISRRVGYGSPFRFSAAFKKRYGVSPQHYRRRVDAAEATDVVV